MATMKDLLMQGYNPQVGQAMPASYAPSTVADVVKKKKPKAFDKDGIGWKALGIIGDGLQTWSGGQATYTPAMMDQMERQREMEAQFDLAERQGQMQRENKMWEWNNKPEEPTAEERNFKWYQGLTPEQRQEYDQFKPVIASTWQGPVPVPRSSLGGNRPPLGVAIPDPRRQQPMQQSVPSGNPLQQPQQAPQQMSAPQQSPVLQQFIQLYGAQDGMRRYQELVRLGGQ